MSIIVIVKKAGKAVIAADTMSTFGSTKVLSKYKSNSGKIAKSGETYLGLVGSAAHHNVVNSIIKNHRKHLSFKNVDDIFETYRKLHTILKDEYFILTSEGEKDPYESSQIDALIANPFGIFGIYSWRDINEYERFWALGSGMEYALGAMHAVYDSDMNAEEIATVGVNAACEFDDGSGLPITLHTITLQETNKKSSRKK